MITFVSLEQLVKIFKARLCTSHVPMIVLNLTDSGILGTKFSQPGYLNVKCPDSIDLVMGLNIPPCCDFVALFN